LYKLRLDKLRLDKLRLDKLRLDKLRLYAEGGGRLVSSPLTGRLSSEIFRRAQGCGRGRGEGGGYGGGGGSGDALPLPGCGGRFHGLSSRRRGGLSPSRTAGFFYPHHCQDAVDVVRDEIPSLVVEEPSDAVDVLRHQVLLDLVFHAAVPVVLDGVVGAPGEGLGDLPPTVPEGREGGEDCAVLVARPGAVLDLWVELVVPALPALLSASTAELRGDLAPLSGAPL